MPENIPQVQVFPWEMPAGLAEMFANPVKSKKDKSLLRGESLFARICEGIKEVYGVDAVIAGGAVRDVVAEVENHRNVDVFIPMDIKEFLKDALQLGWEEAPIQVRQKQHKAGKEGRFTSEGRATARMQGVALDLVFMKDGLTPEIVDGFPVHAQRCIWNLAEGQQISPLAMEDILNKTFTIDPKIKDKEVIKSLKEKINHWKRRQGYKDWKIVEPTVLQWWEKGAEEVSDEIPYEDKTDQTNSTYGYIVWKTLNFDEALEQELAGINKKVRGIDA